ncbi:hypothetical protein CEXT_402841, partial [Caerostris extrusa]
MTKLLKSLCKLFLFTIILVLILLGIAIFRAANLPKERLPVSCTSNDKDYISDKRGLSKRLSDVLKFQTVNYKDHDYNREELAKFIAYINKEFPRIHNTSFVTKEVVNGLSLLYHVQGANDKLRALYASWTSGCCSCRRRLLGCSSFQRPDKRRPHLGKRCHRFRFMILLRKILLSLISRSFLHISIKNLYKKTKEQK